ncbi:LLM class flavin-dependent oxidoreductase [Actinophytocola sediminis]
MTGIRFGAGIPAIDATIGQLAARMEAQGWDLITTGEHVSFNQPNANSFVSLAAVAAATGSVRLLSAVTLLGLYPAALAAKLTAALDNISGGRFELGVGVGGENPREFAACGVPRTERGARVDEALEVMRRLWTAEDVSFAGRFVTFDGVTISPPPVQRPYPPVWVAGRQEAAMRRAARYGDGWLPYLYSPERLAGSLATIATHRERPDPVRGGAYLWTCVHEDPEVALSYALGALGRTYRQDFTTMAGRYLVVGDVDYAVGRVLEYIEAGATTVVFNSACPREYVDQHLALLAEHVVPEVRRRLAGGR